MKITLVAGARPNFVKIGPIIKAIENVRKKTGITYRLIHTGQHYDQKMSGDFFEQLGIPQPHVNLEAGSGSQAEQTATIMVRFEKELEAYRPDVVLVVGDVTSTMACAITAKKLSIEVVHVEAGIRSGDMSMPEEINRIITDSICDHFFTTSITANDNLSNSGVAPNKIHFVGNTMIDTLYQNVDKFRKPAFWYRYVMEPKKYFLITLHRPVNVDNPIKLKYLLDIIDLATPGYQLIFPVHPRTKKILMNISNIGDRLILVDPLGYLEFGYLTQNARGIITDSGGITEEATVLKVPCLTLRNSTERPETISIGTNELIGDDMSKLVECLKQIMSNKWKSGSIPQLWDGKTSDRIVSILCDIYNMKEHREPFSINNLTN